MRRCRTCLYWKPKSKEPGEHWTGEQWGQCAMSVSVQNLAEAACTMAVAVADEGASGAALETQGMFGCVQWMFGRENALAVPHVFGSK